MRCAGRIHAAMRVAAWSLRAAMPVVAATFVGLVLLALASTPTFRDDPATVARAEFVRATLGIGGCVAMVVAAVLGARVLAGGGRGSMREAVVSSPAGVVTAALGTMVGLLIATSLLAVSLVVATLVVVPRLPTVPHGEPSPLRPWYGTTVAWADRSEWLLRPGDRVTADVSIAPRPSTHGDESRPGILLDLEFVPALEAGGTGIPGSATPRLEVLDASGRILDVLPLTQIARGGGARVVVPWSRSACDLRLARPVADDPLVLRVDTRRSRVWTRPGSTVCQAAWSCVAFALDLAAPCLAGVLCAAVLPSATGATIAALGITTIASLWPGSVRLGRHLRDPAARLVEEPGSAVEPATSLLRAFGRATLRLLDGIGGIAPPWRGPSVAESLATGAMTSAQEVARGTGRLLLVAGIAAVALIVRLRGTRGSL